MPLRTTGDLYGFTIRKEDEYGVFNVSYPSIYAGIVSQMTNDDTVEYQDIPSETGLMPEDVVYDMYSYGYTATCRVTNSQLLDWMEFTTGPASQGLPFGKSQMSFTTRVNVDPTTYKVYLGCRVDSLTVKAEGLGRMLTMTVKVKAKWARYVLSGQRLELPNTGNDGRWGVASFPTAERPAGPPSTYTARPSWSQVQGSTNRTPLDAKSWTLTINRALTAEPGIVGDPDASSPSQKGPLTPSMAGLDLVPQPAKSTFAVTIPVRSGSPWGASQMSGKKGLYVDTGVWGGERVSRNQTYRLLQCHVEGGQATNVQSVYDETVTFTFFGLELRGDSA